MVGAIAGRSFLSTGPALLFSLDNGVKPDYVTASEEQVYSLTLTSTVKLETVEIVVNAQVVQTLSSIEAGKYKSYSGNLILPAGGRLRICAKQATYGKYIANCLSPSIVREKIASYSDRQSVC